MIEGVKVRGSDSEPNFVIIDSIFYKVSPELVSFEFKICDTQNINIVGYSKYLKLFFVLFNNGKRYIYEDVTLNEWQSRLNYNGINDFYRNAIQGKSFYETTEWVVKTTPEYVLDAYSKLEYYKTITHGLWATDSSELVIDPENVLFQI